MSKKSNTNFNLKGIDIYFFRSLANCGHISQSDYRNYIAPLSNAKEGNKISYMDNRVNKYIEAGFIKPVADPRTGQTHYKYTEKGENFIRNSNFTKEKPILYFQKAAQYPYHDSKIAEKYFSLTLEQQKSWVNETELKIEFKNYINELKNTDIDKATNLEERYSSSYKGEDKISVPDGKWVTETGIEICWEAQTNSYSELDLIAKENFTTTMHYEIEFSTK